MSTNPSEQVVGSRGPEGPHAVVSARPEGLGAIRRAGINIALWPRRVPQALVDLLDHLDVDAIPSIHLDDVPVAAAKRNLEAALAADAAMLAPLIEDVADLIERYADIAGERTLSLRLQAIDGNACRRFHADMVRLRLLCTYLGPGTQWLPDSAVTFDPAGLVAQAEEAALKQLGRFEVAILKGRRMADSRVRPVVHRSPPIEGTCTTRLLLCINGRDGP